MDQGLQRRAAASAGRHTREAHEAHVGVDAGRQVAALHRVAQAVAGHGAQAHALHLARAIEPRHFAAVHRHGGSPIGSRWQGHTARAHEHAP
ncbi:hypothetical protein D3C72_2304840 [compost metagenome]